VLEVAAALQPLVAVSVAPEAFVVAVVFVKLPAETFGELPLAVASQPLAASVALAV